MSWNTSLTYRPIQPEDPQDLTLLYQIYASTRIEELALVDWDDQQKAEFLQMQFLCQHRYYQHQFDQAEFLLLFQDALPIGRLYVDRRRDEMHIIDIALLPEFRNQGIGTAVLRSLQTEAAQRGVPLRIHVESVNRALHWYQRLGFEPIEERGFYLLMEWSASSSLDPIPESQIPESQIPQPLRPVAHHR